MKCNVVSTCRTVLIVLVCGVAGVDGQLQSSGWTLEEWVDQGPLSRPPHAYVMAAGGRATEDPGAEITLRSTGEGVLKGQYSNARAVGTVDAVGARLRSVTVSGVVQTTDVTVGASLWMRINGVGQQLLFDWGGDGQVRGNSVNQERSIALPVPPDAVSIDFGLSLTGAGTASVHNLRLIVGAPLEERQPIAAEASVVLDQVIEHVKTRALKRERLTADVERHIRLLAAGAANPSGVSHAVNYLIATLADGHSSYWSPARWSQIDGVAPRDPIQNPDPNARAIDRVGYIDIPGYLGNQPDALRAYITRMHRLIALTQPSASCGWIIDLRNNDGGNVFPMLAALKPFLGDGPLGANVGPDGPMEPRRAGLGIEVEPALRALENAWTAVLIGPRTNSAGEGVALAFRGRSRTRLMGQPTTGRTTANAALTLSDGSGLALAVAVMADRTGRPYGGKIDPDELIATTDDRFPTNARPDETVAAAVSWLIGNSGCQ